MSYTSNPFLATTRRLILPVIAAWLTLPIGARAQPSFDRIALTRGRDYGIAVSISEEILIVAKPNGRHIWVRAAGVVRTGELSASEHARLTETLTRLEVEKLPLDEHQDIYGAGTSIELRGPQGRWRNTSMFGCTKLRPSVRPSPAEKARFNAAMAAVEKEVPLAVSSGDAAEFEAALNQP